jgi:acetolactate synthase-1/2/3 large subunit
MTAMIDGDAPVQAAEWVAARYLAALTTRGIQRLFVNAGTDFGPIIEAYAQASGSYPEPIIAAHENLAVGMAHGAFLASGEPQAVMLHVSVGTANAICALMNAARDRAPILLTAGRTPLTEQGHRGSRDAPIHWAQEMFDQAGMLRELVKWDYELRDGTDLERIVDRAVSIADSEPRGPVYLTLPREVLASAAEDRVAGAGKYAVPAPPAPDPDGVRQLATTLARARFPVLVTSSSGADPGTVELLGHVASRYGLGIAEVDARYVNVPASHEHHLGHDCLPSLDDADVLVLLDVDVPWIPSRDGPAASTFIAECGPDPLFSRYPIRNHRADLRITCSIRLLLEALDRALAESVAADALAVEVRERAARVTSRAQQHKHVVAAIPLDPPPARITKQFLLASLAAERPEDAVIVNEYWARAAAFGFSRPGSYFSLSPAGGLGWGLPAALGVKLARRDATVIATLGDGAYLFANPAACHHAAQVHNLPVLTIVCNNERWGAVDESARALYPDGAAAALHDVPLSLTGAAPRFERYVEASGGCGERVSEPADLRAAIQRALAAVARGQQAVLNVICE